MITDSYRYLATKRNTRYIFQSEGKQGKIMKKMESKITVSMEDALAMPEYGHFHEVIEFLQKTPPSEIFPENYQKSLNRIVPEMVEHLYMESATLPLRDVITSILAQLSNELTAKQLLKTTQLIIKKWEKLTSSTYINDDTPIIGVLTK